jgi:integration host factor subunit beta
VTRTELVERIAQRMADLPIKDVDLAVRTVINQLTDSLANGQRIEIRGFGGFSVRERQPRIGRNPKTGETVKLQQRHIIHFKPGNDMRERVDVGRKKFMINE